MAYQLVHTQKCCGTCNAWAGDRSPRNPHVDTSKYSMIIEASTDKARCHKAGDTPKSATESCGWYRAMIS